MNHFSKLPIATVIVTILFPQLVSANITPFNIKTNFEKEGIHTFNLIYTKGTPIEDTIIITNLNIKDPITVHLSAVDALTNKLGKRYYRSSNEQQVLVGKWVRFDNNNFTLNPAEEKKITFKINVEEGINTGEYSGGIAVTDITPSNYLASSPISAKITNRIIKNINLKIIDAPITDTTTKTGQEPAIINNTFMLIIIGTGLIITMMLIIIIKRNESK